MAEPTADGAGRIEAAFRAASERGAAALMPYLMAGFPDDETARRVAEAYVEAGADLIEIGVPFSDPLADGPVIHAAATHALEGGAGMTSAMAACRAVSERVPVVVLCYANMALADQDAFVDELVAAGAAGAIVPDLPLEEAVELRRRFEGAGLALVPLVAPTTTAERRRAIAEAATGFVYIVSTTGTTGERATMDPRLTELVESVRSEASVPVAVGFGVSSPEQAAEVGRVADGVIIGSRLVRAIDEADGADAAVQAVSRLVDESAVALAR